MWDKPRSKPGLVDSIGLGRMVLSYPDLPADVFAGQVSDSQEDLSDV